MTDSNVLSHWSSRTSLVTVAVTVLKPRKRGEQSACKARGSETLEE